ncbi:MAG: hypothetical protein MJ189_01880, partial [Coriobacteriales bacterium]|nr:hypothetical protein [Coriobacteriales bacterium]
MNNSNSIGRKIYTIFLVLLCLLCAIYVYVLFHLHNEYNDVYLNNASMEKTANDIASEIDDVNGKIDAFYEQVEAYDDDVSDIKSSTNKIKNSYLASEKYIRLISQIDHIVNKYHNNDDASDIVKKVEKLKQILVEQYGQIDLLNEGKEDLSNKVDTLADESSETEYPSVTAFKNQKSQFFDVIYPVGSIYVSLDGKTPKYGTWEKLESKRVLWKSSTNLGSKQNATL